MPVPPPTLAEPVSMTRTILIADDEPGVRQLLQRILEPEGYEVIQAESGEQALVLAKKLQIEAFILDIEMPPMNGIELCRALRAMDQYRSAPIMFVTGGGDEHVLEEAFAAGADDFVNKPYSALAIRARLK